MRSSTLSGLPVSSLRQVSQSSTVANASAFPPLPSLGDNLTGQSFDVFSFSSMGQGSDRTGARRSSVVTGQYLTSLLAFLETLLTPTETQPTEEMASEVGRLVQAFFATSDGPGPVVEDLLVRWKTGRVPDVTAALREELMRAQKGRCRGCGCPIAASFLGLDKNYMTCRYLSALFCVTRCGGDDKAVLPGDVVRKWEFTRRKVCKAAANYLTQVSTHPVLRLASLNPQLLGRIELLKYVRNLREQLNDLRAVQAKSQCIQAEAILNTVISRSVVLSSVLADERSVDASALSLPNARSALTVASNLYGTGSRPYLVLDSEVFSLADLIQLHNGSLTDVLTDLVEQLNDHGESGLTPFSQMSQACSVPCAWPTG